MFRPKPDGSPQAANYVRSANELTRKHQGIHRGERRSVALALFRPKMYWKRAGFERPVEWGTFTRHQEIVMRRSRKNDQTNGGGFPQGSLLSSLINDATPIAYTCRVSGDCGMIAVGENVRAQFGYVPEEFLADPGFWALRVHPADSIQVFDEIKGLFLRGEETLEYRFRHADGRYVWLRDEMRLKLDASGAPDRILGRWTDVTGLKLAAASAAHFVSGKGTNEALGEDYAKQT